MKKLVRKKKFQKGGKKREQEMVRQAMQQQMQQQQQLINMLQEQIKERQPLTQTATQAATRVVQQMAAPENQKEATAASDFLKSQAMGALARLQKGEDILSVLPELNKAYFDISNTARGMSDIISRSGINAIAQTALSPQEIANYRAAQETRLNDQIAGQILGLYAGKVADLQNQAMTGQQASNAYQQQLLSTLLGAGNYGSAIPALGAVNQSIGSLSGYYSAVNQPGQGIFSRYILPLASIGVGAYSAIAGSKNKCVALTTKIQTDEGAKQAQHISLGEKLVVLVNGKLSTLPVFSITHYPVNEWVEVEFEDGTKLAVTKEHEFFAGDGAVRAEELAEGAVVVGYTNRPLKVVGVENKRSKKKRVFVGFGFLPVEAGAYYSSEGVWGR